MTKLLDKAFEMFSDMPAEGQDDVARALLGLAEAIELDDIEPECRDAVQDGWHRQDAASLRSVRPARSWRRRSAGTDGEGCSHSSC